MNSDLGALISPQMQHGDLLSSKVVDSAECLMEKQGFDHLLTIKYPGWI